MPGCLQTPTALGPASQISMSLAPKKTCWSLPSSAQLALKLRWKSNFIPDHRNNAAASWTYMMGRMEISHTELSFIRKEHCHFLGKDGTRSSWTHLWESTSQEAPEWSVGISGRGSTLMLHKWQFTQLNKNSKWFMTVTTIPKDLWACLGLFPFLQECTKMTFPSFWPTGKRQELQNTSY